MGFKLVRFYYFFNLALFVHNIFNLFILLSMPFFSVDLHRDW